MFAGIDMCGLAWALLKEVHCAKFIFAAIYFCDLKTVAKFAK